MIVAERILDIEKSANIKSKNFTINASSKAFQLLSAGLYSHSISSIIRELSTNSYDSHVMAGKANEPFQVHLPNVLEPHFSVKDNGIGMSEDQINNMYSQYFGSDKAHTNDLVGCKGLGSKSPFSYTDQFMVISRHNSVKYTYSCFKDEVDCPSIAKMGEEPTTECNGVEVRFAVKKDDFNEFYTSAENVLSWFATKPIVTGSGGFKFKEPKYLVKTDKYGLYESRNDDRNYRSSVVMGNVSYELSPYGLGLLNESRNLVEWGIDLFLDIGEVDVTANREKVSYDKVSTANIAKHLASAFESIKTEIENKIALAPTIWQARLLLHKVRKNGYSSNITNVMYKGKLIFDFVVLYETHKAMIDLADPDSFSLKTCPQVGIFNRKNTKYRQNEAGSIQADGMPVYLADCKDATSRITHELRNKGIKTAYVIKAYDEFLKVTGLDEIVIKASTLERPARVMSVRPSQKRPKALVYELVGDNESATNCWESVEVETGNGGVYFEIMYYKCKVGKDYVHPKTMWDTVKCLKEFDKDVKIYGVRPTDVETLKKQNVKWVSFQEHVTNIVKGLTHLAKDAYLADSWNNISCCDSRKLDVSVLPETSPFKQHVLLLQKGCKLSVDKVLCKYITLSRYAGLWKPEILIDEDKIAARYPLFKCVDWDWFKNGLQEGFIHYVQVIDKVTNG